MPYTKLRVHIVFAPKHRSAVLSPTVHEFLRQRFAKLAQANGGHLIACGGVDDHVHLLVALQPTWSLASFVGLLKAQSTHALRAEFDQLRRFRWQEGYGAFSVDPRGISRVIDYIESQPQHHAQQTTNDDYERME